MCIRQTAQPDMAAASSAPGWRRALTSLIIAAPAAAAACMTSGLLVSTERMAWVRERKRAITGITRRSSSSRPTGCAPGRVDSPPTSMMAAPSSAICTPRSTAASSRTNFPPSENESGVTFSTPMTTACSSPSTLPRQCSTECDLAKPVPVRYRGMDTKGISRGRENQGRFSRSLHGRTRGGPGKCLSRPCPRGHRIQLRLTLSAAQQAAQLQCHPVPAQPAPQQAPAAADWTASHPTPPAA